MKWITREKIKMDRVAQCALSNASLRPNAIRIAPITLSSAMTTRRRLSQLEKNSVAFVINKNQRIPSVA
jgi:hypothetical protein